MSAVSSSILSCCHDYVPTSESEGPRKRKKKKKRKLLQPSQMLLLTVVYRRFKLRKILNS